MALKKLSISNVDLTLSDSIPFFKNFLLLSKPPNSNFKYKEALICSHLHKINNLNLNKFNWNSLIDLFRAQFVYNELILKGENVKDDYFFTSSVDLKTGKIKFYSKEEHLQTIAIDFNCSSFDYHLNQPILIQIGVVSLRFYVFKHKIKIGLVLLNNLLNFTVAQLEYFSFSLQIEKNVFKFIDDEEILNDEFREFLYEKIQSFFDYLFQCEIDDYSKYLIVNIVLLSFSICLCPFKIRDSPFFYLVKWASPH